MSTGRRTMRGRAFQSRAFITWALAGGAMVTDPGDGWIAKPVIRVATASHANRVITANQATRLWSIDR